MKILIPYRLYGNHDVNSKTVTGGTERFSAFLVKHFPDATVVHYTNDDVKNRKVTDIVVKAALENNVDVIVSNHASSTITTKIQERLPHIPVLLLIHVIADSHSAYSACKSFDKFIGNGGTIAMVSQFQQENWKSFASRRNLNVPPISGFIRPAFCEDVYTPVPKNKRIYDISTIGRSDQYKDPFSLHRRTLKLNKEFGMSLNSLVMTNSLNANADYAASNSHHNTNKTHTFIDYTHRANMNALAHSHVYLATWPNETFGISVLEAYERGVPAILYTNGQLQHASQIIMDDSSYYAITRKSYCGKDFKKEYDRLRNLDDSSLAELAHKTRTQNSKEIWLNALFDILEIAIQNNKNKTSTTACLI